LSRGFFFSKKGFTSFVHSVNIPRFDKQNEVEMFFNQHWGNGFILICITLMGLFISPLINGLGASLVATFIGGLSAILIANLLLTPRNRETKSDK